MKQKQLHKIGLLVIATMALIACNPQKPEDDPANAVGAYVLNEGLWGGNDAEISRLDTKDGTIVNNYFAMQNGRGLGDLGQDLIVYGSKMYCAVYTSNTVEVIDPETGKSLQQINMGSRGPRYLACDGGKVYVSCYDKSVVRIDTTTLSIDATCPLGGMQPEGVCALDGKLYVCSGWQQTSSGAYEYDNMLSVVDIATFTKTNTIEVGTNPYKVKALANGKLALCYWGNYGSITPGMMIVNPATGQTTSLGMEVSNFDVKGDDIYLYNYSYATGRTQFYKVDGNSLNAVPILENCGVNFVSTYGINVDPLSGDIYVTDSRNYQSGGDVHCFKSDGTLRFSAATTVGPSKVVFY